MNLYENIVKGAARHGRTYEEEVKRIIEYYERIYNS